MSPTREQAITLARQAPLHRAPEVLQLLHAVNPHDTGVLVLHDYALCLSEIEKSAKSIPLFQHLPRLAPDHANGRVVLGVAFAATGDILHPKMEFQWAVGLEPANHNLCALH